MMTLEVAKQPLASSTDMEYVPPGNVLNVGVDW